MIGTRVSHYEITERLGEGGMGIVYKATDTKLNRPVALKFLPAHLSASEDDKTRFIREAQAASTMNHPNICTIYSIEEFTPQGDGNAPQLFIAMEWVDGQNLRDKKNNFSVKQIIDIGAQVADGLAAAHEHGIVHRDIKPENLMIRKDGIVQIMDFGLAKLRQNANVSRLTKAGSTIGTLGYMSPEQVQGEDVDHRTDIFSLGVVLYELLGGQPPFKGVHETAIIYEIVNVDAAPLSVVRQEIDPELDRIILECLEKDKDERYQSAKELSKDLKRFKRESGRQRISRTSMVRDAYTPPGSSPSMPAHPSGTYAVPEPAAQRRSAIGAVRGLLPWILAAVGIGAALWLFLSKPGITPRVIRATIEAPDKVRFNTTLGSHIAISPNGETLAFVGTDSIGQSKLWIRQLNSLVALPLPGTEDATYPFWSPDSRNIGFFAGGKLKKIEASGGPALTICDAPQGRGGAWNKDGIIVFAGSNSAGLSRVPSAGGEPRPVTSLDSTRQEINHRWPCFLSDGNRFLYVDQTSNGGQSENDAIFVASLDSSVHKLLLHAASNMTIASGRLLFVRQETIVAQPFDEGSLELRGEAVPVAEHIEYNSLRSSGSFSVSQNGILVFLHGSSKEERLAWFDRTGRKIEPAGEKSALYTAVLSPDGKKIALDNVDPQSRNTDIWLYDLVRKVSTRFTYDQAAEIVPVWSPDGSKIVFSSDRKGHMDLYVKAANGSGTEELVWGSELNKAATAWSPDGNYLCVSSNGGTKTQWDLWLLPLTGDKKPVVLAQSEFNEWIGSFSPDGKWVVYQSNESGRYEIYVRPVNGHGEKWQISTTGGQYGLWSKDGKVIYFEIGSRFYEADVKVVGGTIQAGAPRVVFDLESGEVDYLDVSSDGRRILMRVISGGSSSPVTLVSNWDQELNKH